MKPLRIMINDTVEEKNGRSSNKPHFVFANKIFYRYYLFLVGWVYKLVGVRIIIKDDFGIMKAGYKIGMGIQKISHFLQFIIICPVIVTIHRGYVLPFGYF